MFTAHVSYSLRYIIVILPVMACFLYSIYTMHFTAVSYVKKRVNDNELFAVVSLINAPFTGLLYKNEVKYTAYTTFAWPKPKLWLRDHLHIDGLVQERRNSSALAMLRLYCNSPSIWSVIRKASKLTLFFIVIFIVLNNVKRLSFFVNEIYGVQCH